VAGLVRQSKRINVSAIEQAHEARAGSTLSRENVRLLAVKTLKTTSFPECDSEAGAVNVTSGRR
jgi:hypothetical protein